MIEAEPAVLARLSRRFDRERRARLEAEAIAERFTREALHDGLTGLPNRTLFVDRLAVALERCAHRELRALDERQHRHLDRRGYSSDPR